MWSQLWRDPVVRLYVALQALVLVPYFVPVWDEAGMEVYSDVYSSLPLMLVVCAALFAQQRRAVGHNERDFWMLLGATYVLWIGTSIADISSPAEWAVSLGRDVAFDVVFVVFYLLVALAVNLRPDLARDTHANARLQAIHSAGTVILFFGLLVYFAAIPRALGVVWAKASWPDLVAAMLLYVVADLYLLARLAFVVSRCASQRWRAVYVLLWVTVLSWLCVDVLEALFYSGSLEWETPGHFFWDLPWYVPHALLLSVARVRAVQQRAGRDHAPAAPADPMVAPPPWGGPLVIYAAAVPIVHFAIAALGLVHPQTLRPREICVVALVALLAVLAILYQRVLEAETLRLGRERRSIDEQLQMAQRMEAVGRLAGGMAHDFNNNLQVIQACAEMQLEGKSEDDPDRPALAQIAAATQRAASLTAQLLTVARRARSDPEAQDLNEIISQMGPMLRRVLHADVTLRYELDPRLPPVRADRGEFEQVIMNIVINARDAMPDGGELVIRTVLEDNQPEDRLMLEPEGPLSVLTVSDTGHGIDEVTRLHIFEPFFTTKGEGEGTGLGLSVVYGIVQRAGGHISVDSAEGAGSTFRIALPAARGEPAPRAADPRSQVVRRGESETVLVVEDEDFVRTVTERLLDSLGYETLLAESGEQALDVLEKRAAPVDLLLTDVVMAGMSGVTLAQRVRASYPSTKILFMTGYSGEALRGVHANSSAILRKPFGRAELAGKVRAVLDRH